MSALRNAVLLCLLLAAPLAAQPAPLVGSTLRTTSTAAGSVRVGCTQAGSCTGGLTAGPVDVSSVTSAGFIEIGALVPGACTNRLVNTAGTLSFNCVTLATGASLSGTLNAIPVFTSANSVGDSIIAQNAGATLITVTGALTATGALTGTLATVSQPNVTTMAGLTTAGALATVGTITSGTWNGTIITIARGGTGVSLSGTGGTSQFLRQNTVGGTITVVRPAISDLSDSTNVALRNAVNTFTAAGTHLWTAAAAGANVIAVTNTTSGAAAFAALALTAGTAAGGINIFSQGFTTSGSAIASGMRVTNPSGGGIALSSANAAGSIGFYTGASDTLRWAVNPAGDWTVGSTAVIADAVATPTISSGFGAGPAIAGRAYAFRVTIGTGGPTSGTVAFNATFTPAPVCVATSGSPPTGIISAAAGTTSVAIANTVAWTAGDTVNVLCRGF